MPEPNLELSHLLVGNLAADEKGRWHRVKLLVAVVSGMLVRVVVLPQAFDEA